MTGTEIKTHLDREFIEKRKKYMDEWLKRDLFYMVGEELVNPQNIATVTAGAKPTLTLGGD